MKRMSSCRLVTIQFEAANCRMVNSSLRASRLAAAHVVGEAANSKSGQSRTVTRAPPQAAGRLDDLAQRLDAPEDGAGGGRDDTPSAGSRAVTLGPCRRRPAVHVEHTVLRRDLRRARRRPRPPGGRVRGARLRRHGRPHRTKRAAWSGRPPPVRARVRVWATAGRCQSLHEKSSLGRRENWSGNCRTWQTETPAGINRTWRGVDGHNLSLACGQCGIRRRCRQGRP